MSSRNTVVVGIVALLLLFVVVVITMFNPFKKSLGVPTGLNYANDLVASYGRHLGVNDAKLDQNNNSAFGESSIHYDQVRDVLVGYSYVAKAMIKTASATGQENYRRMEQVLNDPKVGGMFEQNGGYFVLDEEKEAYFLVKDFKLTQTNEITLWAEMDDLENLAATWRVRWFFRVAKIMNGFEVPSVTPVTRKNDSR